jgi:hypothetical protein
VNRNDAEGAIQDGGAVNRTRRTPIVHLVLGGTLMAAWGLPAGEPAAGGETAARTAGSSAPGSVPIEFDGFLPGSRDPRLKGSFDLTFRIYTSPGARTPIWEEARRVEVSGGRFRVLLGEVRPISMDIHRQAVKFLGIQVADAKESIPRYPIVNVIYASTEEALADRRGRDRERPADPDPRAGLAQVSSAMEPPATWHAALLATREAGKDLPTFKEWYASLASCPESEVASRTGHYEWVLPWVYDTASHGEYNRLFRGRFGGCKYTDLSPERPYAYRAVDRGGPSGEKKQT